MGGRTKSEFTCKICSILFELLAASKLVARSLDFCALTKLICKSIYFEKRREEKRSGRKLAQTERKWRPDLLLCCNWKRCLFDLMKEMLIETETEGGISVLFNSRTVRAACFPLGPAGCVLF